MTTSAGARKELRPPERRARRRILRFVAAYLLLQLLVPLSYYLRDDPYDERFAWRMFSPIREHVCRTTAHEAPEGSTQPREIVLARELHVAWARILGRNRRPVIDAFLRKRCEAGSVAEVELTNQCKESSGMLLQPQRYVRHCDSGKVDEPAEYIVPREER